MSSFLNGKLHNENFTQSICVRDVSVNGALLDVTEPLLCGITEGQLFTESKVVGPLVRKIFEQRQKQ